MQSRVRDNRGSALLLALVLLLVLSLLAISTMEGSIFQERMSTAQRAGVMSLETAESGLNDAEAYLESLASVAPFNGTNGLYGISDDAPDPHDPNTWSGSNVRDADAVDVGGGSTVTPRYYIKHTGEAHKPESLRDLTDPFGGYSHDTGALEAEGFRIVVFSEGPSGNAQRIIQSYYTRVF